MLPSRRFGGDGRPAIQRHQRLAVFVQIQADALARLAGHVSPQGGDAIPGRNVAANRARIGPRLEAMEENGGGRETPDLCGVLLRHPHAVTL
jgi:hypothetical protein